MLRKFLIWVLPIILLLTACGPAVITTPQPEVGAPPASIDLTDGLGREVKLGSPARRVVSLAPSNTEILFAIGAGSQVVGRDELSDYPEGVAGIQSVGGSMGNFSTEAIVALKPGFGRRDRPA
jgi:iron complex transport system substrate-binding protein